MGAMKKNRAQNTANQSENQSRQMSGESEEKTERECGQYTPVAGVYASAENWKIERYVYCITRY